MLHQNQHLFVSLMVNYRIQKVSSDLQEMPKIQRIEVNQRQALNLLHIY